MRRAAHTAVILIITAISTSTLVACIIEGGPSDSAENVKLELSGFVRDSATQAVVAGAAVTLYRAESLSRSTVVGATTTNAAGHYVLTVQMRQCFTSLIALGVTADGYRHELQGYGFDPPNQSPQCTPGPQAIDFALGR